AWMIWSLRGLRLPRLSIRAKLQLAVALGAVAPFGIGLWQLNDALATGERLASEQLEVALNDKVRSVERRLTRRRLDVATVGENPLIQRALASGHWTDAQGPDARQLEPTRLGGDMPGINEVALLTNTGEELWRDTTSYGMQTEYARHAGPIGDSTPFLGKLRWDILGPAITDTVPIVDAYHQRRGFLVAKILVSALLE